MTLALLVSALAYAGDAPKSPPPPPAGGVPADSALMNIRRVFVDRMTGGESAAQMRELIISALQAAKLFVITENEDRADVILRGAAEDLLFTDKFSSNEGLGAKSNSGDTHLTGKSTTRSQRYGGLSLNENESVHIEERKHEALAVVRLVNKDGDVIWSTTQESTGGKFRGAGADVADKIARQLTADLERIRKGQRLP